MHRLKAGVLLFADFLWHVVTAGATTAWWILRPGRRVTPAVIALSYSGLSDTGAVLYACLLSLTPGTTTIDLDVQAGRLVLHVLDGGNASQVTASVRQRFERPLQTLFPGGRR